jgi:parvulin-like peptidyl-prolyl isomerase
MRCGPGIGVLVGGVLLAAAGCGDDAGGGGGSGPRVQGDARIGGQVVSTVDGVAITVDDVRRRAEVGRIAPREALRQLQDDMLLAAEAERRGLGRDPRVVQDARRAAVQALLREQVEASIPESSIEPDAIARAYQRHLDQFQQPERRASKHVLVRVPPDAPPEADRAARARIEGLLTEVRAVPDPTAWIDERLAAGVPGLVIEEVPGLTRHDQADAAYLEALYALPAPGLVPGPVRTGFGWHAILLTEVIPARNVTLEEATPELRRSVLDSRRRARVAELIEETAGRTAVEPNQDAVRAALARDPDAP